VRLVAAGAGLHLHRRVLEREWPALVGVAPETARLVCQAPRHQPLRRFAVGIVAVDAFDHALGDSVSVGPIELSPHVDVARRAQRIDLAGE